MNCQFYLDFLLYFNISYHLTYDFIYQGSHTLVLLESLLSYRILPKQVLYCLFVEHIHQYLYNTLGSIKQMHYNNTISFLTACSWFVTKIVYFPNSRSISMLFLLEIFLKTSWILLDTPGILFFILCGNPVYFYGWLFYVATLYIFMGDYFMWQPCIFLWVIIICGNPVYFYGWLFYVATLYIFMGDYYMWQPCIFLWVIILCGNPVYFYGWLFYVATLYIFMGDYFVWQPCIFLWVIILCGNPVYFYGWLFYVATLYIFMGYYFSLYICFIYKGIMYIP